MLLLLISVVSSFAQKTLTIRAIRDNKQHYLNEVVVLEGEVQQYVAAITATSGYYIVKDDWGDFITVRTSMGAPITNKRYKIAGIFSYGTVSTEQRGDDYFISENSRSLVDPWWKQNILVVVLAALLVMLIIAILWLLMQKRPKSSETPKPVKEEGETIKVKIPPPGTLKVLPGRFEIVAGESSLREFRFFKTREQIEQEITFGRSEGGPYNHIKLDSQTVSRKQAKMVFSNNEYTLFNYAGTDANPTRVNGKSMEVGESIKLKDDDKIAMGEVEFLYHAK